MTKTAAHGNGDLGRQLARHGRPTTLDLSDDRHYAYACESWEAAGRTRERQPHLFDALERTRAVHRRDGGPVSQLGDGDVGPVTTVTGFGFVTRSGTIEAVGSGVYSTPGGSDYAGLTMQLVNADTQQPIGALATVDDYVAGIYQPIQASGAVASEAVPVTANLNAAAAASADSSSRAPHRLRSPSTTSRWGNTPPARRGRPIPSRSPAGGSPT